MDSHDQPTVEQTLYNQPTSRLGSPAPGPSGPPPSGPPPRIDRPVRQKRARTGLIATGTFFLGLLVALVIMVIVALVFLSNQPDRKPVNVPPSTQDATIVARVSANYVQQVVKTKAQNSGFPGTVSNVQVTLLQGDQMTVQGDDQFQLAFLSVTKPFTLHLQLYANSCTLKVHVLHVDLAGIPGTDLVAGIFESQMNQQTQLKSPNLPDGFTYCMTSVQTDPQALIITYTATPTS